MMMADARVGVRVGNLAAALENETVAQKAVAWV